MIDNNTMKRRVCLYENNNNTRRRITPIKGESNVFTCGLLFIMMMMIVILLPMSCYCSITSHDESGISKYISNGIISSSSSSSYQSVHPSKDQCLLKPHGDPAKLNWYLNCSDSSLHSSNAHCESVQIRASKMLPTFCVAIQLFTDSDPYYVHVNETDNFYMGLDNIVLPYDIRFRVFCYYQYMGTLENIRPVSFCYTRYSSGDYSKNCTEGFANEELDQILTHSNWSFNERKPLGQYSTSLTEFSINIPLRQMGYLTRGLQMQVLIIDIYSTDYYVGNNNRPNYIIPLITNNSVPTTPYWESECDAFSYNTRPQYYIWKLIALCIGASQYFVLSGLLIWRRKHRLLESRFIIPIIATSLSFLQCVTNIILNVIYYDNEYDLLIEDLVIIFVMSLHLLQSLRYNAIRLFYYKFYSKRDSLLMRVLLSKLSLVIGIIVVAVGEGVITIIVLFKVNYNSIPGTYSIITVVWSANYLGLLGIGLLSNVISNFKFVRRIKSPKKVLKWLFLHDDHFRYNGEMIVLLLIFTFALLHPIFSEICGNFLALLINDPTRPISKLYLTNGFGYALYGSSKIMLVIAFGFQYFYLIGITIIKDGSKKGKDFKKQKEEFDLFISKTLHNGTSCMEIMRNFLIGEFKLELLEVYLFLKDNSKSTLKDSISGNPNLQMFLDKYFTESELDNRNYEKIAELLLECFSRLKQTIVYEIEYVEQTKEVLELVFNRVK